MSFSQLTEVINAQKYLAVKGLTQKGQWLQAI